MARATLDAGALIAHERRDRAVSAWLDDAALKGEQVSIPAGVLAQVFRDPRTQVRLVVLLSQSFVKVVPLDGRSARLVGAICKASGASDVVDASVVLCAQERGDAVLTSDPDDLLAIDPRLRVVKV